MTVSPSSQKVDDFLSSLSHLSQERLSEDQSRQRRLERNINDLRSSNSTSPLPRNTSSLTSSMSKYADAPSMKFNREGYRTPPPKPTRPKPVLDDESPPTLPRRRDESPPPSLPRRRDESPPPTLPQRRVQSGLNKPVPPKPMKQSKPFEVNLVQPVARDTKPGKYPQYNLPSFTPFKQSDAPVSSGKYRSFSDMESTIKGDREKEEKKPLKPVKANWLTSSMTQKPLSSSSEAPKPSYLSALSASQNSKPIETVRTKETSPVQKYIPSDTNVSVVSPTRGKSTSWIDSAVSRSPGREKVPPVIKPKPKPVVDPRTEAKPEPIKPVKLAPIKPESKPTLVNKSLQPTTKKPSYNDYKNQDNELLLSQLSKIKNKPTLTPKPKPKPANLQEKEELQSHLRSLSPTRKNADQKSSIARYREQDTNLLNEQITRLGKRQTKPPLPEKLATNPEKPEKAPPKATEKAPEKPDFKAHLSSLIRAGTAPQLGSPPVIQPLQRSGTDPFKREDTQSTSKLTHPNKSRAKGPKRRLPKNLNNDKQNADNRVSTTNTTTNTTTDTSSTIPKNPTTSTKSPPPLKPKPKLDNLTTTLKFQGDVFI